MNKKKTFNWQVAGLFINKSLDSFICNQLNSTAHINLSIKNCKQLIDNNELVIFVNQKKVSNASFKLNENDNVKLDIPIKTLKELSNIQEIKNEFVLTEESIIWEDKSLLIASKPKGIPSLQTLDPSSDYFLAAVKRLLIKRDGRVKYLALHHRLDVDTSGLMLFCKKKSLNKDVGALFSQRKIQKIYHALCRVNQEVKENKWEVKNHLKQIEKKSLKRKSVSTGGDFAHSSFEIINIDKESKSALISSMPHTGRTHQLRVHLSEYGLPIIGDDVYGEKDSSQTLQLHCKKLSFTHPVTLELIEVTDRF